VTAARRHKAQKSSLLLPTVLKGYRVPRQDWAFLGAVRQPDKLLFHQFQDQSTATLAISHQDTAQATAHAVWPISLAYQSAETIHDLAVQAQELARDSDMDNLVLIVEHLEKISLLTQYSLMAAADSVDCVSHLNADNLKKLRGVWLDQSQLLDDV
jgi:hypothetical protein